MNISGLIRLTKGVEDKAIRNKIVEHIARAKKELQCLATFERLVTEAADTCGGAVTFDYRDRTYSYSQSDGFARCIIIKPLTEEESQALACKTTLTREDVEAITLKADSSDWLNIDMMSAKAWLTKSNWTKPFFASVFRVESIGGTYDEIIRGIATKVLRNGSYSLRQPEAAVKEAESDGAEWSFSVSEVTFNTTERKREFVCNMDGAVTSTDVGGVTRGKSVTFRVIVYRNKDHYDSSALRPSCGTLAGAIEMGKARAAKLKRRF